MWLKPSNMEFGIQKYQIFDHLVLLTVIGQDVWMIERALPVMYFPLVQVLFHRVQRSKKL